MDSLTEFISQSVEKLNKDKTRVSQITEENLPNEIDIQFYRDLYENLKLKADKVKVSNPLTKIKINKNKNESGNSSQLSNTGGT